MSTASSSSKPSGQWQPPTLEEMQAMLPQYQFVSLLGRGGMGAVYKAVQVSLDRAVAIKVLPVDLIDDSDAQFSERFKNEARTMAKMNHPAIVNVYDFGETQTGLLYIVMEFIDGTDVAKMISSQGKLPEDYALSITAHVCDALSYAHRHGIIHRDIKPANILINMEGAVKVADFGLAKASDAGQSGLTKTNMAMGTPDFVAPEALIPGVPLDGRADLYAIGVMLYQMLTGEIPRGLWTLPGMKLGTDPRFDAIISKAMQTDRDHRYQSAADLRRDLDTILTLPRAALIAQQQAAAEAAARATQAQKQQAPTKAGQGAAIAKKKPFPLGPVLGITASLALVAGLYVMFTSDGSKKPARNNSAASPSPPAAGSGASKPAENTTAAPAVATTTPAPAPEMPASPASVPPAVLKPELVQTFRGNRYQLIEEPLSWDAAKAKAESMGGHLATITSKEEWEWVKNLLMLIKGPHTHVLIGGHRASESGPWAWVTGEPFDVSLWPANPPTTTDPHLAFYLSNSAWDDVPLGITSPYLVEWDDEGTPPMPTAPATVASTAPTMPAAVPATSSPASPIAASPADPLPPGWTDLLAKADPAQGAVTGQWQKGPDGLVVKAQPGVMPFDLNQIPSEQYDFEMDFTVHSSEPDVAHILPLPGGHWFIARLSLTHCYLGPTLDGQQPIGRKEAYAPDAKLAQSRRHRSLVQIRKDSVRLLLDEKETLVFNGDLKRLTPDGQFALRNTANLGIASHQSDVTFHRIGFRPHDPSRMDKRDRDTLLASNPRLAQLEAGFQTRYQADTEKPFLAALAKLNQSYVANGIAKARAAAQSKGSLFEVTMLDAEKALIEKGGAVPAEDAAETPTSLTTLRTTYRAALAKITTERDAKAAPLYDLYLKAIDAYTAELTQGNKIDEATKVKAFRDEIAAQRPVTATVAGGTPSKAAATPAPKAPPGGGSSWRIAADYLVNNGGFFTALKNGVTVPVTKTAEIPPGRFDIIELTFERLNSVLPPAKDADFAALNGLRDLRRAQFRPMHGGLSDAAFAFLANNSELNWLNLEGANALTDEVLTHITPLKKLDYLGVLYAENFTGKSLDKIAGAASITNLELLGSGITDDGLRAISKFKKLQAIRLSSAKVTAAGFAALSNLKTLATLTLGGTSFDDEAAGFLAAMTNLTALDISTTKITDVGLAKLMTLKKLSSINLGGTAVSLQAAADFQKALPQCRVNR